MQKLRSLTIALGLAAGLGVPALAQQNTPPGNNAGAVTPNESATTNPAPGAPAGGTHDLRGTLQKTHGAWRSSKLVGATVYNDSGQSIGTVDDLLVGDDGKISQAVVSVGGFLGIGSKLVALPYDQLKFEPSTTGNGNNNNTSGANTPGTATPPPGTGTAANTAATPAPGAAPGATSTAGATTGAAVNPGATPPATTGTAANSAAGMTAPAGQSDNREYFTLVLPGASKNSLTSMPDFKYNES
jgi:sporulation protein YlmC with PRC-barrel domain